MATRVRSYSKINLGLAIGPVRGDGFHGLATLYQTLALHDVVTVSVGSQRGESREPTSQNRDVGHPVITLTTNHPQVPADERNTAWKMVEKALARMGVAAEVAIHIEKALPVQGGLGAGSANAAAALIGLERELGWALPEAQRMEMAAEVGSDVPLFLVGGAVFGVGRGEICSAMPDFPVTPCVVAVPEVGVSTPQAFRDWDALRGIQATSKAAAKYGDPSTPLRSGRDDGIMAGAEGGGLTSGPGPGRLEELSHVYATCFGVESGLRAEMKTDPSGIVRGQFPGKLQEPGSTLNGLAENPLLALVRTGIENDFEQVVFPQYPLLREIKHELMGTSDDPNGAVYAALSGSGSALFGLYRSAADARAAQQRVQATGCKALLTETLPRPEYWRTMFAE
jgi:4-diphosphocytidyl-2-C-methyl-D-erythritol kinase